MSLIDILTANRDLAFNDERAKALLFGYVTEHKEFRYQDENLYIHMYCCTSGFDTGFTPMVEGFITDRKIIISIDMNYYGNNIASHLTACAYSDVLMRMVESRSLIPRASISDPESEYYGLTFGDLLPKHTKRAI